jgi:hypothetical protein
MGSNKLSVAGTFLAIIMILLAIAFAHAVNPFEGVFARIFFSAIIGGLAGGLSVVFAHKLGLTKKTENEDN